MFKFFAPKRAARTTEIVGLHPDFIDLGRIDLAEHRDAEKKTAFVRDYGTGRPLPENQPWIA